jgi:hypothetical protein
VLVAVLPELSADQGLEGSRALGRLPLVRAISPIARLLSPRALAAVAAGVLTATALELAGGKAPLATAPAAALAMVLVALLPRAGWLAAAAAVLGWLAWPGGGHAGVAAVGLAMAAVPPLLLTRAGLVWSVPALAPVLGALGLAPLYVALAGLAGSAHRRAALAIAGFGWLALAEPLLERPLLFGVADGTAPLPEWRDSATGAASDVLHPLLSSPGTAPIAVWVALAAVVPLLVRGRSLVVDVAGAALWAAALVATHRVLGEVLAASVARETARGVIAGALLGAAVVVLAARSRPDKGFEGAENVP